MMTANTLKNDSSKDCGIGDLLRLPPRETARDQDTSFLDAFAKFLTVEAFHDLTLQGNDGIQVPCNRYVLASRSDVLQTMLLGPFKEGSSDVVELQLSGEVIQALVEYLHTNDVPVMQKDSNMKRSQEIDTLVSLAGAAFMYNLPGLCYKIIDCVNIMLKQNPTLMFTVLQSCNDQIVSVPHELKEAALSHLWSDEVHFQCRSVIQNWTYSVLQDIVWYQNLPLTEFDMFRMIHLWATIDNTDICCREDRKHYAMEMMQYVKLEKIHPIKLSTQIAKSGLVTPDQLCEAYKSQALAAAAAGSNNFEDSRGSKAVEVVWAGTGHTRFEHFDRSWKLDIFSSKPIITGKYRWTIHVQKHCNNLMLGVMSGSQDAGPISSCFCGSNERTWGFSNDGTAYHKNAKVHSSLPTFSSGSKVTMTLEYLSELTASLSASVDNGNEKIIFSRLKPHAFYSRGFTPAASVFGSESDIRMVEYKKLR